MILSSSFLRSIGVLLIGVLVSKTGVADTTDDADLRYLYQQHALTNAGDPERGKKVFADEQKSKCLTCHKIDEAGGMVGPNLSGIGGKFDRPHLIESLLEPSRQIVEGYRTTNILTVNGEVIVGIQQSADETSIVMQDAAGKSHTVARDDIQQQKQSDVSLMPSGLATTLSKEEFTDLIAYLEVRNAGFEQGYGGSIAGPIQLPEGYRVDTIATGLDGAVAMEVMPDGRALVCEQPGDLRVIKDGVLLDQPMLTRDVELKWERGLIGVTVHPDFANQPYVYVCYVTAKPHTHHRISRFRVEGDVAIADSEEVLIEGDDQSKLGGNVPAGHQGGAMHFGGDGMLYIGLGEQTAGMPAQELDTLQGKILRIEADGSIPPDNPFVSQTTGKYQSIWAIGCRNPFTFAFDSSSQQMLINDVGGKFEEINPGVAGGNYGWPVLNHGFTQDPSYVGPIHVYPESSISGGDFGPPHSDLSIAGRYFFADFVKGWIHSIDPSDGRDSKPFAAGLRRPVDLRFAPDGSLYVLLRNAWVADDKLQSETGSLLRIYKP